MTGKVLMTSSVAVNPFAASTSKPGHGNITLSLLPPATQVLQTLSYQYPLKLIAPTAASLSYEGNGNASRLIHTVFLLTYGGGLVAGDSIKLSINLMPTTRLILLTQGSTKIFKSQKKGTITSQYMNVDSQEGSALCYLPDPVQPFGESEFKQHQVYNLRDSHANLCVCDWVSEGRPARNERWNFHTYTSKNEVWLAPETGAKRLLLRDNMILDNAASGGANVFQRMEGIGIFGSLILGGNLFHSLGEYFLVEFKLLPRIGSRQWDPPTADLSDGEVRRATRIEQEKKDGILWSAASIRGFVIVKFCAREVEGAKMWLKTMLKTEGTIEREFGERALLCLR